MKKLKRILVWFISNIIFGAVFYAAGEGVEGAGRLAPVVAFFVASMAFFGVFALLLKTGEVEVKKKGNKERAKVRDAWKTIKESPIPFWIDFGVDQAFAWFLIWEGFLFSGILWTIQAVFCAIIRKSAPMYVAELTEQIEGDSGNE